jgi:hypothetical protein
MLTEENYIQEEITSRLKLWNSCYHSEQNLLSSRLLSKNLKIKIYRTIILPVVLYVCETWSLILMKERRLRLFENWVLRRVSGPKRDEVTGNGESCITLNDIHSLPNIVRVVKSRRMRSRGMWRVWGRREVWTVCWCGNLRGRSHWGVPDVDERIILKWIFRKLEWVLGIGWSWFRIGTGGRYLGVWWGTFGFHKIAGDFLTRCKDSLASQEELCSME